jgi:hypothetical protein
VAALRNARRMHEEEVKRKQEEQGALVGKRGPPKGSR